MHGLLSFKMTRGVCKAIIENHHDVRTESNLDIDCLFRTQEMRGSIQMRLEPDTVFINIPQRAQAEYLVTTTVGQYRTVPCHKPMQSSQLTDRLLSRPQEEVIRIAQENLDAQVVQLIGRHRLDCGLRAHGHENRSLYKSVRRMQTAAARTRFRIFSEEFEFHSLNKMTCHITALFNLP